MLEIDCQAKGFPQDAPALMERVAESVCRLEDIEDVGAYVRVVDDEDKKREICTRLVKKFTDDEEYLRKEMENAFPRVNCLELEIEHMTGKLVNES